MTDAALDDRTDDIELRLLLEAIFHRYHYDFRGYALASLRRRLHQARIHFGCRSYSALQEYVLHDATVLPKLLNFMTVQVSELFRDPLYFRTLREQVVPYLKTYPSLKVWVAGCSGGEELYSLAILFREEGLEERTMFYATDISPVALQRAESGVYELQQFSHYTQNYQKSGGKKSLADYFTTAYGAAAMDRSLRSRAVFSDHSLVTDAVFAEVHLISCRNVLIYFDRPLQDRVVGLFRDSLAWHGFLGLGAKETLRFNAHAEAFAELSREARIYQKRGPS